MRFVFVQGLQLEKTRQRQDKTRQDTTRQDKTRHDKTRQDKTRQDKTRQDKTRGLAVRVGVRGGSDARVRVCFCARGGGSGFCV